MHKPLALALLLAAAAAAPARAQLPAPERGAAALGEIVEGLGVSTRVLLIAAHPDDEDTRLITWLSRGRHADVAYLSLTRGDGGQNLIGNELGEALGALRTEELLAARRIDGAHQYFTRAYDYGFSKSADEAFRHWPHDSVLGDVVTTVRAFRPHVIIAIFSGTPEDGHGQHQASGILAREAFDAAADTVRFPRARTAGWPAWTPLKFYRSRSYRQGTGATFTFDAGEYSPLLGRSYAEIAAESRSQHRSQAQGTLQQRGPVPGSLKLEVSRVGHVPAAGQKETTPFAGIDTTWARLRPVLTTPVSRAALDSLVGAVAEVRRTVDPFAPARSVPLLARARRAAIAIHAATDAGRCDRARSGAPVPALCDARSASEELLRRVDAALGIATGLAVEATVPRDVVARGATARVAIAQYDLAGAGAESHGALPLVQPPGDTSGGRRKLSVAVIDGGERVGGVRRDTVTIQPTEITQPWWLARPRRGDMYDVPVNGTAEDMLPSPGRVIDAFGYPIAGRERVAVELEAPVVHHYADPVRGDVSRPLAVVPKVSVTLDQTAAMLPANTPVERVVRVTLRSGLDTARAVRVRLTLPGGMSADSAARTVTVPAFGARQAEFRVRGRLAAGNHELRAAAELDGERFTTGYTLIDYEHVRPQRLYRDAALAWRAVDVTIPAGLRVAYVQGANDNSIPALRELGIDLAVLQPAQLATVDLSRYTTLVIGPRAYEAVPELRAANARLLDWVEAGGTMLVQYGQTEMQEPGVMPYPITLARPADRVTIEEAPVRVLDASSPLLGAPNRITPADFAGWVQDRSLYMPRTFDPRYAAPLETHDPGEPENRGALLAVPYGRGTYVYTTLAFFRQLPAGVPGAARLFVNLLAAGNGKVAPARVE